MTNHWAAMFACARKATPMEKAPRPTPRSCLEEIDYLAYRIREIAKIDGQLSPTIDNVHPKADSERVLAAAARAQAKRDLF